MDRMYIARQFVNAIQKHFKFYSGDIAISVINEATDGVHYLKCLSECHSGELVNKLREFDIYFENGVFTKGKFFKHKDPLTAVIKVDFKSILLSIADKRVSDFLIIKSYSEGVINE